MVGLLLLLLLAVSIRLKALCLSGVYWGKLDDGVEGVVVATTAEEAIFLNFLWVYIPASSSHLCSTGSTVETGGSFFSSDTSMDSLDLWVLSTVSMLSLVGRVDVGLLLVVVDDDDDLLLDVVDEVS